jgi:glucose-6-phosphate isomerase
MTTDRARLTALPAWHALTAHFEQVRDLHLRSLFASDPSRGERLVAQAAGLYLDYSKNRITDETIRLLVGLADACSLRERIKAMFSGERLNTTEQRAVLHVALRAPRGAAIVLDGDNVVPTTCSIGWRRSPCRSGMAGGTGTLAIACAPSSTSGLAAPISARSWRTKR